MQTVEAIGDLAQGAARIALNWATFYRAILGPGGLLRREFPAPADLRSFETTEAYGTILGLLAGLRARDSAIRERQRVITVRLPESVHAGLITEAHEHQISLNQLCVVKLLAPVRPELAGNGDR